MTNAHTLEKLGGSEVRQFSVFLENKVGALLEVVKLMNSHGVVVLALSIQDASESSLARMVVSDPGRAESLFREHDIAHSACEVLIVELAEGAQDLTLVLSALLKAEVNVYFSYPMMTRPRGRALLAMHVDDLECASAVLRGDGFQILNQSDLSR